MGLDISNIMAAYTLGEGASKIAEDFDTLPSVVFYTIYQQLKKEEPKPNGSIFIVKTANQLMEEASKKNIPDLNINGVFYSGIKFTLEAGDHISSPLIDVFGNCVEASLVNCFLRKFSYRRQCLANNALFIEIKLISHNPYKEKELEKAEIARYQYIIEECRKIALEEQFED